MRIETATPPFDKTFLDFVDENGPKVVTQPSDIRQRTAGHLNAMPIATANVLLATSSGTINTTQLFGREWSGALTQAVAGLRGGQFGADTTRLCWWPLGLDWTGFPASARVLNLRYRFTSVLQRATPITGDGRLGIGLNFTITAGTLLTEDAASSVGVEISSKPSVNGGRWTCWWRSVSAGALSSFDTGVTPDGTFHGLGWHYDTGTGLFAFLVDDEPVQLLSGAAVPQPTSIAGNPIQRLGIFCFSSGVANQQDRWGLSRLTLQRL